jgi:hypothetical protein
MRVMVAVMMRMGVLVMMMGSVVSRHKIYKID